MMEILKVMKSQNVDFLTLNSQTLIIELFKCNLNLKKMNIHAWEVEISQDG